jgi:hypothetical protein
MAIGGMAGAGIGAAYAIATWDEVNTDCGQLDDICDNTAAGLRFIGSVGIFGIGGMAVGAVLGAAIRGNRWQTINVPLRIGRADDACGTIIVRYSCSF